jgi:excisionase family DNA binding protein
MLEVPGAEHLQGDYRVGEVAELLEVPASTIRSWEDRYGIRAARTDGGHRRYTSEDVDRLRALRDLVSRRHRVEDADAGLVLAATRELIRAREVSQLTAILVAFVRAVGGEVLHPDGAPRDVLALDLAFGEGEPLLARAPDPSVARIRIEQTLPGLVDDARFLAARLRSSTG